MAGIVYLGIDPGLQGGIAYLFDGEAVVYPTPTIGEKPRQYFEAAMVDIIARAAALGHVEASIENQHAMPGQGVTSMFSIGLGFGMWRGILAALGIPYTIVTSQSWRKVVELPKGADKGASVALAQRLFPGVADSLIGPRGGIRDGLAEALLIAEARRRVG